ncbi:hypothetical protein IG631_13844 [Alternaria alternata]|nr:hypothetical protein IG631_13844 [Alternaria alternata]
MAIVRLIIFMVTIFAVPPGLWLYPNLFEDVGFFDSFRPVWAWQETPEDVKAKKAAKKEKKAAKLAAKAAGGKPKKGAIDTVPAQAAQAAPAPAPAPAAAPASAPVDSAPQPTGSEAVPEGAVTQRAPRATVEEVEDE